MKLYRVNALIERDMRKFFRSPALMLSSLIFPLVQLVVLGYAFGGKIKHADLAFVDEDHSVESRRIEEMFAGVKAGPETFRVVEYGSFPRAVDDLRAGFVKAVVDVPHDFSRRYYQHDRPRLVFTEDNTDQFISNSLMQSAQDMTTALNTPDVITRLDGQVELNIVEVYPYIEYIKYLLAGSTAMASLILTTKIAGCTKATS
jgi:ABC-2 type transport system permease protein